MSDSIEPAIDGAPGSVPGINIDWLFSSPRCGITLWECATGKRDLSDVRSQSWHVVSFVHSGAFVLHTQERRASVIDATSVLLLNPGEPYRSEHPFGCCDRGSSIVVRRDALLDLLAHHDPTARERPDALFPQPHVHGLFRAYLLQRLLVRRLRGPAPQEPLAIEEAVLKVLDEVAKRYEARPGQIALAWLLQRSSNILLIPGTSSVAHLRENLA